MSNPWLVVAGAAIILAALGWIFSFMIRDLGWRWGLSAIGFSLGVTAVFVAGAFLLALGIKGEL